VRGVAASGAIKTLILLVGAAGFEPASPCAQGKLGRPVSVLISEQFAASESWWAQTWDPPCGDAERYGATKGDRC